MKIGLKIACLYTGVPPMYLSNVFGNRSLYKHHSNIFSNGNFGFRVWLSSSFNDMIGVSDSFGLRDL